MGIKQLQRVALDENYRPYSREHVEYVTAPKKPGFGYWLAMATMMAIAFGVMYWGIKL